MATGIAPAIVAGAGTAIGGFFGVKGQKRAAQEQRRAQEAALTYQRGRDTIADQRRAEAWAHYQKRYADWLEMTRAQLGMGGGGGGRGRWEPTLADLASSQQPIATSNAAAEFSGPAEGEPPSRGTLGDLAGGWGDWRNYYRAGA